MTTHASRAFRVSTVLALAALLFATAPGIARADEVIAADTTPSAVTSTPGTVSAPAFSAAASLPRGIVVANHAGRPVTVFAKGEGIRRATRRDGRPITFTRLTPGRVYTVEVGGVRVGSLRAVDRPAPATSLTVRTTTTPDSVALTWRHPQTTATGGSAVTYTVTATSRTASALRTVTRQHRATLAGLDPDAVYTFTVVPRNSAGAGRGTRATMNKPLGRPAAPAAIPVSQTPAEVPRVEAAPPTPAPAPVPAPAPAPAPAPKPSTKTIYVCPTGYVETSAGLCETTKPYTFTYAPYTFHDEVAGPAPLLESYATAVRACPTGWNLEDYGWVMYCRRYGPAPTVSVKDAAPTGYTDDGTRWVKKDDAPAGYSDDGTTWVKTVAKEAVVVPA